METVVRKLKEKNKTISVMESCTGGGIANSITNISGASEVFKYGAVTYSNEFKIRMGVNEDIIRDYTVYSLEVADEMSYNISKFVNSNYGIGVTGQINESDPNNVVSENNKIYISIYDNDRDKYYNKIINTVDGDRVDNKNMIICEVVNMLLNIV